MRKRPSRRRIKARFRNGRWIGFVDIVQHRLDAWVKAQDWEMATHVRCYRLRRL